MACIFVSAQLGFYTLWLCIIFVFCCVHFYGKDMCLSPCRHGRHRQLPSYRLFSCALWIAYIRALLIAHICALLIAYICALLIAYRCALWIAYICALLIAYICALLIAYICLGWASTIYLYVYTVYIRCFWQGNHHAYGHIRYVYTVPANPTHLTECVPGWH